MGPPQDLSQPPGNHGSGSPAPAPEANQGSQGIPPVQLPPSTGAGAIRVGSILLLIAVAVGVVGSVATLGRFNQSSVTRDVIIDGKAKVTIPGRILFRVAEPLSEEAPERMRVGLVVEPVGSAQPTCELKEVEGDSITLERLTSANSYASPAQPALVPVAVAELKPGRYEISCETGESGSPKADTFTVTRVVGLSDMTGEFRPLLWFAAVMVMAGMFFLAGGITLFIGLVIRGRSKRVPEMDPTKQS